MKNSFITSGPGSMCRSELPLDRCVTNLLIPHKHVLQADEPLGITNTYMEEAIYS